MTTTSDSSKRPVWQWVALALVAAMIGGFAVKKFFFPGKPHIIYRHGAISRGSIRVTILSTGTVAPENRLDLKPAVAGRVEKVLVAEGDKVKAGQILAWLSSTERATLIDTARSVGKKEVKYWEDAYKMTPILAPKDGLVILKSADSGQTVTQTDIVLSVSDRLIVKTNVDETDLAQIKDGQMVTLILDAFPQNPLPGKVVHIGYDAKTVNNVTTYEVDVVADSPPDYMKSGMTANATFLVSERENVLLAPAAAVRREEKRTFILMPNPDNKNEPLEKDVEVGLSDGKKVEIASGVNEGDAILLASLTSLNKDDKATNPLSFGQQQRGTGGSGGGGRGR